MAPPTIQDPGISSLTSPDHNKGSTSLFLCLPREIRDEICVHLLKAGDVAITRTSKQLAHETGECLRHEGVLRMNIGAPGNTTEEIMLLQGREYIRTFRFRYFFGPGTTISFSPPFRHLGCLERLLPNVKRRCVIVVEFDALGSRSPNQAKVHGLGNLFRQIAGLTNFTTLVVRLAPMLFKAGKEEGQVEQVESSGWLVEQRVEADWCNLKSMVEDRLGPGKLVGDADGKIRRMVLEPVKYHSSLPPRQQLYKR